MIITKVEGRATTGNVPQAMELLRVLRDATLADRAKNGILNFFISVDTEGELIHVYEEWDTLDNFNAYMISKFHLEMRDKIVALLTGPPTSKVFHSKIEDEAPPTIVLAVVKLTLQEDKVQWIATELTDFKDFIRENYTINGNGEYKVSLDHTEKNVIHVYEEWGSMADFAAYEAHSSHAEYIDGKLRPSLALPPNVSIYEVFVQN